MIIKKHLLIVCILIQAIFTAGINSTSFISSTTFQTGYYLTILQNDGLMVNSLPSYHSFSPKFSKTFANLSLDISIGIVGFTTPVTNDFAFNTTVSNFTTNSITIGVKVSGDMRLFKFGVNFLIFNSCNEIQILNECFNCLNLSSGSGPRSDGRSLPTKFTSGKIITATFLTGFYLNSKGKYTLLQTMSYHLLQSTSIKTVFTSDQNNTVYYICYTIISVNQDLINYNYQYTFMVSVGQRLLPGNSTASYLDLGSFIMDKYKNPNQMFFGMGRFRIKNKFQRIWRLDTASNYSDLGSNYFASYSIEEISVSYFLQALLVPCSTNYYYDFKYNQCVVNTNCTTEQKIVNSSFTFCSACHYSCLTCAVGFFDDQCNSCDSLQFRYNLSSYPSKCQCLVGYINIGTSLCASCGSFIRGCSECTTQSYKIICTRCSPFLPIYNGSLIIDCACNTASGYFYHSSNLCMNTTGCISWSIVSTGVGLCNTCDTNLNFNALVDSISKKCSCMDGFALNGPINSSSTTCSAVCGDSKIVSGQFCDDGNTNDGDGCSSKCKIEPLWICNNLILPSVCTLITGKVMYVQRIKSANQMRIHIDINPYNNPYTPTDFRSLIIHNIPSTNYSVYYQSGSLVLDFDYNETIQGNTYKLVIILNSTNPNDSLSFDINAKGMNAMLTYDKSFKGQLLSNFVIVLDGLVWLALIVSIFSEKLMGVETLLTIQSVYFSMSFLKSCPVGMSSLQLLRYSNGYVYDVTGKDQRAYEQEFPVSSLGIQKQFLLNFNIMFLVLIIPVILLIILRLIIYYQNKKMEEFKTKQEKNLYQQHNQKYQIIYRFIFRKIFVILSFGSLFIIIFSGGNQLKDVSHLQTFVFNYSYNLFAAFFSTIIIILFLFLILFPYIYPTEDLFTFKSIKPKYVAFFTAYQTVFITLISFGHSLTFMIYVVISLSLLNLIIVCKMKPYPQTKHNIGIACHQILRIICLCFYAYVIILGLNGYNEVIFLFGTVVIVGLMYLTLFFDFYRFWRWRTYNIIKPNQFEQQELVAKVNMKNIKKKKQLSDLDAKKVLLPKQNESIGLHKGKDFQWVYNAEVREYGHANKMRLQQNDVISHQKQYEKEDNDDYELRVLKKRLRKQYLKKFPDKIKQEDYEEDEDDD